MNETDVVHCSHVAFKTEGTQLQHIKHDQHQDGGQAKCSRGLQKAGNLEGNKEQVSQGSLEVMIHIMKCKV